MATATLDREKSRNGLILDARLDEGLRVEIVTITPDLAAKWLKRNYTNRPVKRPLIARLVRALQAGHWDNLNGETIVFSDKQSLIDGQHRLLAVVEAQLPITTLVVFGVQEQRRGTIDTGIARQLGDHLSLAGHPNANSLAAAVAFLKASEEGGIHRMTPPKPTVLFANYDEAVRYLAQHPGLEDSVRLVKHFPKLLKPAHAAVLDYRFRQTDAAVCDAWHETMRSGHLTPPYQVFLTLRERLIRDKTDGITRHSLEQYIYNIKAWNAARQGRDLKVFKWYENEELPVIQ